MKNPILYILLLLACRLVAVAAPTIYSSTVVVDTNNNVISPSNFWSVNASNIVKAAVATAVLNQNSAATNLTLQSAAIVSSAATNLTLNGAAFTGSMVVTNGNVAFDGSPVAPNTNRIYSATWKNFSLWEVYQTPSIILDASVGTGVTLVGGSSGLTFNSPNGPLTLVTTNVASVTAPVNSLLTLTDALNGYADFKSPGQLNLVTQPFAVSFSGTNVTVGAGKILCPDGSSISFSGGTVPALYSTSYLVVNLGTTNLHCLYRAIDDGSMVVATVKVSAGACTLVSQPSQWAIPPTRLRSKAKLLSNPGSWRVKTLGDSLTEGAGSGIMWNALNFQTTYASSNYNVPNCSTVTWDNLGAGGTTPAYGLALVGKTVFPYSSQFSGYCHTYISAEMMGSSVYTGPTGYAPSVYVPAADLYCVEWVNNCNYYAPALEGIVRELMDPRYHGGLDVLALTANDDSGTPGSRTYIGTELAAVRDSAGGNLAIADTEAYVREINDRGTNTFYDSIHQVQVGWNAYAEAVLGCLNSHTQTLLSNPYKPGLTLPPATAAELPFIGQAADFVSQNPLELGNYTATITNYTDSGISTNKLFGNMGLTTAWLVTTNGGTNGYITFVHSHANWATLIFRRGTGTNSFSGYSTWLDTGGNAIAGTSNSFSYATDLSAVDIPGNVDLQTVSSSYYAITNNLIPNNSGWWSQTPPWVTGALRIYITSGAARILGVVFGTPHYQDVPLFAGAGYTSGTFANDFSDPAGFLLNEYYSDTLNNAIAFKAFCRGMQVVLRQSTSAGQIRFYGDGTLLQDVDLYHAGRPPYILLWMPGMQNEVSRGGFADRSLVMRYYGNNGSKAAATTGYHALTLAKVTLFD